MTRPDVRLRPLRPLRLLLTSLGAVLAVALAGSPAPALAAGSPSLTLAVGPTGRAGVSTPFTATVLDASGAPASGVQVTFQPSAGSATTVKVTTDAQGQAVAGFVRPLGSSTRTATASVGGTPVTGSATTQGLQYASTLTLSGPSRLVDERSATLSLRWTADGSALAGAVTVYRRLGSGAWTTYAHVRTVAGKATLRVTPRVDSAWRATGAAGTWWRSDTSGTLAVDNVPPGTPVVLPAAAPKPVATPAQARATGAGAHPVITTIPTTVWRTMVGRTWHSGCPVGRSSLRLLRINYWGFDGYRYRGEMVLSSAVVGRAAGALSDMYAGRFPIRRMYREDRYGWSQKLHGANDYASMRSDNTSGFNCRSVVNKPGTLSPHARGRAIDVNTWENPYRSATGLVPNSWWASRSHPRVAWRSSTHPVVRIWRAHGFHWTYGTGDSQHVDGRTMAVLGGFSG